MKSRLSFLLSISIILALNCLNSNACGPYPPIIPTPEYFNLPGSGSMDQYNRMENLLLWQAMTSDKIPLSHIEQAVYKDSKADVLDKLSDLNAAGGNKFYNYLVNNSDREVQGFLLNAKEIEERRRQQNSPWYYPANRYGDEETDDFHYMIERCRSYKGTRLADRYALQIVRCLFSAHRYDECIDHYEASLKRYPDSNLMKRMAQRYVAGCWSRLGDKQKADSIFAKSGDIWSIEEKKRVVLMTEQNPNAPQIMDYIRSEMTDSARLASVVPVAKKMLRDKRVARKGDWAFLLSYYYREYARRDKEAKKYLDQAMANSFSSEKLHDLAYAYRIKLNVGTGDTSALLSDLKWLDRKLNVFANDFYSWERITRNIMYEDMIPYFWKQKSLDYAIMLASYADNLRRSHQLKVAESNLPDYTSLSFQMMGSLSSEQLAYTYQKMMESNPLNNFLRKKINLDKDYVNELIGTLALREENYARAINYLSEVSDEYQRTMNINREGYLDRDPFKHYPSRWKYYVYSFGDYEPVEHENSTLKHGKRITENAKLKFAKQMLAYRNEMNNGSSADNRGLARLMYAIGRRNSFEECWALTQYWRGKYIDLFSPQLDYDSGTEFSEQNYAFLYDYENSVGHKKTETLYNEEIRAAMAMLKSDEARAEAEYILGNVKTVIKRYGETSVAKYIRTSCDNWSNWL